jgi:integrase
MSVLGLTAITRTTWPSSCGGVVASRLASGRWRARIFLPGGGERTKVFASKREAVTWEIHNRGRGAESKESLTRWLERIGPDALLGGLSPSTRATYRSHLSRRIIPEFGHRALSAITAAHIESAQRAWKSDDISPTVVAGTLNCLSRLFRFAIKVGDLSASPMSAVERARAGVERVTPTLMVEEVDRLAVACDLVSRRYGDYVRLAALLGLRAGELTALQVGDVNLTTGVVTIRRAFSAGELQTPKSRRVRQVPVLAELVPILDRLTRGRRPAEPVLLGPLGGRLYHSNFRTKVRWSALVGELGWPGLRFHDLRATAIVLWIRAEVPLTTVRALAGHASLATTDRYARIARNDLAGAAAQVDSYISRTRGEHAQQVEDHGNSPH